MHNDRATRPCAFCGLPGVESVEHLFDYYGAAGRKDLPGCQPIRDLAQAAELLAFAKPGTGPGGWPLKARAQDMFRRVVHPACSLFCGRTNDGWPQPPRPGSRCHSG